MPVELGGCEPNPASLGPIAQMEVIAVLNTALGRYQRRNAMHCNALQSSAMEMYEIILYYIICITFLERKGGK